MPCSLFSRSLFALAAALFFTISTEAWVSSPPNRLTRVGPFRSSTGNSISSEDSSIAPVQPSTKEAALNLRVPVSMDEMNRQVARAMHEATKRNQTRMVARILLPRDATADDFGTYYEADYSSSRGGSGSSNGAVNTVLVPPDESWQGGIMQLYRAAAPACESIIRQFTASTSASVVPRILEDRSIDESGVDGVGVFATDDGSVRVYLQPTLEVADDLVQHLSTSRRDEGNHGITMLLNPQWRQVDDALDSASKGTGFLSGLANFLGGKGGTLKRLADAQFESVYCLEGYVCRGSNIRLLQVLQSDWAVFCQRDENNDAWIQVGTLPARPTYQQVESMLEEAGISFKYARDMGWQPKL